MVLVSYLVLENLTGDFQMVQNSILSMQKKLLKTIGIILQLQSSLTTLFLNHGQMQEQKLENTVMPFQGHSMYFTMKKLKPLKLIEKLKEFMRQGMN